MAAFVPTTSLATPSTFTGTSFAAQPTRTAAVTARRPSRAVVRASIQDENRKAKQDAEYRGPQGFTFYSEKVNGRMAMIGFVLALMTEVLNPAHPTILRQVAALADVLPFGK